MKRRIAIILLLLIGGAIVNVAVAWGCTTLQHFSSITRGIAHHSDGSTWQLDVTEGWGVRNSYSLWLSATRPSGAYRFPHPDDLIVSFERKVLQPRHMESVFLQSAGLPLRSLWCERLPIPRRLELPTIRAGGVVHSHGVLPFRPILPGFIINTLFYAALLWLLFIAPFTARHMLRRRRGQCAKCAYPIGVSPVCTECGAEVPRKVET